MSFPCGQQITRLATMFAILSTDTHDPRVLWVIYCVRLQDVRGETVIKMSCCYLLRQSIFLYFIANLFSEQKKKKTKKKMA